MHSFFRIIHLSFQDILRNFWLSLVIITMMVLALASLNILIGLHVLSRAAVFQVQQQLNVEIALRREATPGAIEQLRTRLVELPEVREVVHYAKEDSFIAFKEQHKDRPVLARTFESLDRNPLGDSFSIRLQEGEQYEALFAKIRSLDTDSIVEDQFFQDYETMIGRLERFITVTQKIGVSLIALFGFIAALVIVNTLRIAIYTHREEIAVMKLVGATNQFIQIPYIVQIILLSLVALGVSIILLGVLFGFLQPFLHTLFDGAEIQLLDYYKTNGARLIVQQYFGITILGLIAALLAIYRYAKV